ncbi:hypothetical protein [Akkermansia muciniphila]|uniref:hypothetical protein n=1 Tax=Akkermansia muciniphila TaxID=239935 RepID=UPI000B8EDA1C|nr:hypothetical protein [Akkermansia muciniphila]
MQKVWDFSGKEARMDCQWRRFHFPGLWNSIVKKLICLKKNIKYQLIINFISSVDANYESVYKGNPGMEGLAEFPDALGSITFPSCEKNFIHKGREAFSKSGARK